MGQALAEALARAGLEVHGVDPLDAAPDAVSGVTIHADIATMASALTQPRRILMMVTAGDPVDAVIASLKTCCNAGDTLIDGGNSFYRDTERRTRDLPEAGLRYLGAGISGGEEGARNGASVMVA
jgi:6-phosphogluconate dehydrogenase